MKNGIIFDLDGTLWDATGTLVIGWNQVFAEHNFPAVTKEYVASYMGKTSKQIAAGVFPFLPIEEAFPIMKEAGRKGREAIAVHGAELFPREREILEELSKNYVLCILTNSSAGYVDLLFEVTGFRDLFTDSISHGENGLNKTENIRILMERNQLDAAAYIGDTRDDQIYSEAVPVPFIFAAYGHGQALDPAYTINTFSELPQVVNSIFSK